MQDKDIHHEDIHHEDIHHEDIHHEDIHHEDIHHVCSLGTKCISSQILKRNGWKKCSYPFDWIFSDYKIIINCLEDDFKTFLDKSFYIDKAITQCSHKIYNEQMFFNHHNPLINENDYNYFTRCVNRFRDLLKKDEHKLFIMTFINNEPVDKDSIIYFNKTLKEYTSCYTLLVISHISGKKENNAFFTEIDTIHFLELHTLSGSGGVQFTNNKDNIYLDNILKQRYKFKAQV